MDPSPYLVQKADVDQVRAFTAFCMTGGNVGRTAILCHTSNDVIEALAHDFDWAQRVKGMPRADTDEGLAEAKALNRISIYMVAERAKSVISNIIDRLHDNPDEAMHLCIKVKRIPGTEEEEVKFDPKALGDLVGSLETVSNISYRALGDKVAQEADVGGSSESNAQSALGMYKAMMNRWDTLPKIVASAETAKVLNQG